MQPLLSNLYLDSRMYSVYPYQRHQARRYPNFFHYLPWTAADWWWPKPRARPPPRVRSLLPRRNIFWAEWDMEEGRSRPPGPPHALLTPRRIGAKSAAAAAPPSIDHWPHHSLSFFLPPPPPSSFVRSQGFSSSPLPGEAPPPPHSSSRLLCLRDGDGGMQGGLQAVAVGGIWGGTGGGKLAPEA